MTPSERASAAILRELRRWGYTVPPTVAALCWARAQEASLKVEPVEGARRDVERTG